MTKRPVINIETLEVFDSLLSVARVYNVTKVAVYNGITLGHKTKGNRFEYFDIWKKWPNRKKEKYTLKNNIYFL